MAEVIKTQKIFRCLECHTRGDESDCILIVNGDAAAPEMCPFQNAVRAMWQDTVNRDDPPEEPQPTPVSADNGCDDLPF